MLTKSMEDYLERILRIEKTKGFSRVSDIAKELDITYPSVSEMLKKLSDMNFVKYEKYGNIILTKKGKKIASSVEERHNLWVSFLVSIGIEESKAKRDACKLEHDVSGKSMKILGNFLNYILKSEEGEKILKNFLKFNHKRKGGKDIGN